MTPASYVIVSKETGKAVFETFEKKIADAINTEKYKAVPILEYLYNLNDQIKAMGA